MNQREKAESTINIPDIQPGKITVLTKVNKEKIADYPNTMYSYQRLMNNLIGAIGIIKGPGIFYPYLDRDQVGNIYINDIDNALTGIDIKTIDIANVHKKTEEFIERIADPETKNTLQQLTGQLERRILSYFYDKQKKDIRQGKRYGKIKKTNNNEEEENKVTYPRFFSTQEEKEGKHIMEALYNMMGKKRVDYFDYDKKTNICSINQTGKERLLKELYQEIDDINTHRFTNIEDIFPGSDYPQVKNKSIQVEDIEAVDIIYMARYLLSAHHSIDDMMELYSQLTEKGTPIKINKSIRKTIMGALTWIINKGSTSSKVTSIINTHEPKAKASKLKRNRGFLAERIMIAAPYLEELYDFSTIEKTCQEVIEPLIDGLNAAFPKVVKHVSIREKTLFSAKNKILRDKSITDIWDMIGLQIFIDSSYGDRPSLIKDIFAYINEHINQGTINNIGKVMVTDVSIDNRTGFIEQELGTQIIKDLDEKSSYTVQERKGKTKKKMLPAHNEQEVIINFFSKGSTGGNGGRATIKEIIKYQVDTKEGIIDNTSGIEAQILPYGESIDANEAHHQVLETQKTTDLIINTNSICPWEDYCKKKDVAITTIAASLKKIKKDLDREIQGKYTKEMFEKERYYTININDQNREFINKTKIQRENKSEIIQLESGIIKIDQIALEEISSSVIKRQAADFIIIDQVNKELQSGKIIQYHYHDDINDSEHPHIDVAKQTGENIIEKPYPWITNIHRDETGELLPSSINFINPGSKIRINTAQTPRNAYVFIPNDDGEKGYIQSVANLSYALKTRDITQDPTKNDLLKILNN